jgi:hypothetical protein
MANNRQITRQYLHLPYCSDLFITPTTSIKHITSFLFLSLHSLTARCYHTSHSVLLFASSSLFPPLLPSSSSSLFFLPLLVTSNMSHIALSSLTSHYFILFYSSHFLSIFSLPPSPLVVNLLISMLHHRKIFCTYEFLFLMVKFSFLPECQDVEGRGRPGDHNGK